MVDNPSLVSRYVTLFADSISTAASVYTEDMDTDYHDPGKIIDIESRRQKFGQNYKNKQVTMLTHPIMRRFCDVEFCDKNMYVETSNVAAVSCIHNCIQTCNCV